MFLLAVGLWMQVAAGQPTLPPGNLTVQTKMQPETVTVGQHFTVSLTVHAPASMAASIQFPSGPDTSDNDELVTMFAPPQRHDVTQGGYVNATMVYSLSAWAPGQVEMALDDVMVANARLKLPTDTLNISSVLPKDPAARKKMVPRPLRQLLPEPPLYKRLLRRARKSSFIQITLIVVLLLAALIAWLLWRRSRRLRAGGGRISSDWVDREFERVEKMGLVERGEGELYSILMTKIVRDYLIQQFPSVRASATTRELVSALKREKLIPADQTIALLERVDLLKFAHDQIKKDDAFTVGKDSRTIVHEIMDREEAARVAAALEAERAAAAVAAEPGNTSRKSA